MVSLVILALFNRNTPSFPRRGKGGGKGGGRLYFFISAVLPGRWAWHHSACRHRH